MPNPKPILSNIDPKKLFLHAAGFYRLEHILSNIDIDKDPQVGADIGSAAVVISALNSELFFKCLICIETGLVPRGHHLFRLFTQLSARTRSRIEELWDNEVVPFREARWKQIEAALGRPIKRDLASALEGGSVAFEKIRYSYEGNNDDVEFYISDLPRLLGRVVVELKPEFAFLRRPFSEVPKIAPESEQPHGSGN
jgi:hypothetical protein